MKAVHSLRRIRVGKNLADEEYDVYGINPQAGFGHDKTLATNPVVMVRRRLIVSNN
ncbi:hypothetical protein HNQ57_000579 [Zhongshania antarctica]|uniref:Uncharacterized protein n=1 Tax=Zhongshania antarctica TaxID=641702 RepID=A0A840R106_9GAMM|nr:hypothetical protein [Zhongshania antarctica]MBB5186318.1 hypothetical protein [Zhongshania antarctica]